MARIAITIGDTAVGHVEWITDDRQGAIGHVERVSVPENREIERRIRTALSTNGVGAVIKGGRSPAEPGRFGDGVYSVLDIIGREFGFDFDRAAVPMPQLTEGVMY